MGKKRILAIVPTYYPQTGGAEKAVYELYKGIADEYATDLLCPDYGGKKEEFNGFFNVYRVCKTTKILPLKLIKYQYFAYQKARKLLKEQKYDIIHCHYILPSGVAGVFLKKKFRVPLVITENHFGSGLEIISQEENPAILMPIMRHIAKKADALVSISRSQDLFLDELGKGKFKYTTVHLGGDSKVSEKSKEQLLKELKIARNKRIIFSVSRLVKRKNYDNLIRAANEVCKKRKDVLFLIGGKGPELDS
jgi:glycosyltransferase involved in cell wall biosynthesis